MPLDVVAEHLNEEIFVLGVLLCDTSGIGLSEDVLADTTKKKQISCAFQHSYFLIFFIIIKLITLFIQKLHISLSFLLILARFLIRHSFGTLLILT